MSLKIWNPNEQYALLAHWWWYFTYTVILVNLVSLLQTNPGGVPSFDHYTLNLAWKWIWHQWIGPVGKGSIINEPTAYQKKQSHMQWRLVCTYGTITYLTMEKTANLKYPFKLYWIFKFMILLLRNQNVPTNSEFTLSNRVQMISATSKIVNTEVMEFWPFKKWFITIFLDREWCSLSIYISLSFVLWTKW